MNIIRTVYLLRHVMVPGLLALALLAAPAGEAQAQTGEAVAEAGERPWTLGLALGHGRRSNPFVASEDIDINAVLDLAWYGERFFFDNGDFGYTLNETARFSVSAVVGFNNERNYFSYLSDGTSGLDILNLRALASEGQMGIAGGIDESELAGLTVPELEDLVFTDIDSELPERDFAVNGGFEMLYLSEWGDLQAQVLTDLGSTHNGETAWLSWSYPWLTAISEFSLTLGLEWKSRDLVDYYYGVTPGERLPGRPTYEGGSGTNGVVRFAGGHALSEHWKLVGVLEREYLSSAIRHSPIIKDSEVDTFYIGLYYQF